MRRVSLAVWLGLLACLFLVSGAVAQGDTTTVTLFHFTDYHSHAVPFYSEGEADTAGIARAIAYLEPYADDPDTLIFNGGDTMNLGTPAWSDKYQCVEWPWWNGIVDAMAFGNHDADYGPEVFADCRAQVDYPILAANVLGADGEPLFLHDGERYLLFDVEGVQVGVFALAGADFARLLRPETMPAEGITIADRTETAREVVAELEEAGADAIVLIGHALYEEDVALAQAVPGIDLIFGTHSHRKEEGTTIPESETVIISPFQYLTYISQAELTFEGETLQSVDATLVPMSADLPQDDAIIAEVQQMQADLQADPDYAYLYETLGEAQDELSTEGQFTGEASLGNWVTDIVREETGAHLAISTASSFREPIPPGPIQEEDLRTAIPYKNKFLLYQMTGEQVQELLDFSVAASPSDFFSQLSGVRFNIEGDQATNVQILRDPRDPAQGYAPLDPSATYTVAASDFQSQIAGGYKEIFAKAGAPQETAIADMRDVVRERIRANSPIQPVLDGRMSDSTPAGGQGEGTPPALPSTGGTRPTGWPLVLAGAALLGAALLLRRRAA